MIIRSITDLAREAIENKKTISGFMGISIRNKFFSHKNLEPYFVWASEYFKEFTILLMDDPDRHNYILFSNNPPEEAITKARRMGEDKRIGYKKILKNLGITNIKIIRFVEFENEKIYTDSLKSLFLETTKSTELKEDLVKVLERGIGGKIMEFAHANNLSKEQVSELIDNLLSYVIEELAATIYLTETGSPIEIDPYAEVSTKKLIYENNIAGLYEKLHLTKRGHVFVHPEDMIPPVYSSSFHTNR